MVRQLAGLDAGSEFCHIVVSFRGWSAGDRLGKEKKGGEADEGGEREKGHHNTHSNIMRSTETMVQACTDTRPMHIYLCNLQQVEILEQRSCSKDLHVGFRWLFRCYPMTPFTTRIS